MHNTSKSTADPLKSAALPPKSPFSSQILPHSALSLFICAQNLNLNTHENRPPFESLFLHIQFQLRRVSPRCRRSYAAGNGTYASRG